MSDVGQNPFTHGVKVLYFGGIPPYCGPLLSGGKSLDKTMSILLCISMCLLYLLGKCCNLIIRSFSEENYAICTYKFVVFMGEDDFTVFYIAILNLSSGILDF